MRCGCPSGSHPVARNYLESAAEREGPVCKLGWPVGVQAHRFTANTTHAYVPQVSPIAKSTSSMFSDADIERIAKRVAEMNAPKPDLHATTDASVWAREFCRMHGGDEGLMIGWFANAIMAGHDAAERKARE